MGLSTPLHPTHLLCGATLVDFGGWDMPLHYGSQLAEHRAVRQDAGMFDVSHMCVIDTVGQRVREFLRMLLANDVDKLVVPGKALYSCMLRPDGGVLDDLIVYFLTESSFRLVVNAGTRDKDLAWITTHAAAFDVQVSARRELAMIAVQGPNARIKAASVMPPAARDAALAMAPFVGRQIDAWFIARTGYTGEDGFEIMLPAQDAADVWQLLRAAGVAPAGLGARDTLRLEAGMNLYGSDMDETHHPLESALEWTVAFDPADRDFIGRQALERARAAPVHQLVGLLLEERGVLRSHQRIFSVAGAAPVGEITSGTFSPTLNRAIALARVPRDSPAHVQVDIRGKLHAARIVEPPFVRRGTVSVSL